MCICGQDNQICYGRGCAGDSPEAGESQAAEASSQKNGRRALEKRGRDSEKTQKEKAEEKA